MKEDKVPKSKYWNYDGLRSVSYSGQDFDNFFLVCTQKIIAYVSGQRTWKRLNISGAKEPVWNQEMIDTRLVIDQDNLKTIKALASRYTKYSDADVVDGW